MKRVNTCSLDLCVCVCVQIHFQTQQIICFLNRYKCILTTGTLSWKVHATNTATIQTLPQTLHPCHTYTVCSEITMKSVGKRAWRRLLKTGKCIECFTDSQQLKWLDNLSPLECLSVNKTIEQISREIWCSNEMLFYYLQLFMYFISVGSSSF